MKNRNEDSAAEGVRDQQTRRLTDQEAGQVRGGMGFNLQARPGKELLRERNQDGKTVNMYCERCGFFTPHTPLVSGGYCCIYCRSVSSERQTT